MTGPAPPPELLGIALPSTWLDWIRLVAFLFTGPVVVFGAWLAWRRTRAAGIQADVSAQRQITETFSRAVEHLGNQEAVAVRIGAIYALERIAKTTPEEHWQVVETLAAFVRERAPRKVASQPVAKEADGPDDHGTSDEPARTDVEAALTVIGRRETGREAEHQRIDLRETNLDGLELLKVARRRWPGIPFVLLTINDSLEHLAEARKNGVDAYVIKPFSLEGLRDKIISAIRKRLALGGDKVDESDVVYLDVINRIETLTESARAGRKQTIDKPLAQLEGAVERVLFSAENRQQHMSEFLEKAKSIQGEAGKHAKLVQAIVDQLAEFVRSIEQPNPIQLEIVKLHVEAIQAVLSGRLDSASEIDGETLIKGLQMAIAKAAA